MKLLKGDALRDEIIENLKEKVAVLDKKPGLAVVEIGDNPASKVYIKQKEKMANTIGYNFFHIQYCDAVEEDQIIKTIEELNNDDKVHAIIVQMPIAKKFNSIRIQNTILPTKDVDGLTYYNIGALVNDKSYASPCTALGIVELLKRNNIEIASKNVAIVGRSNLVGRPLSVLLTNLDATVTLCHSKTKDLAAITRNADILIVAIGKKEFIKADMIRRKAVVIDVGINRVDGKLCGDVDFECVKEKCSYITPVPGGVGPMTIAMLAENVYKLYLSVQE